MSGMTRLARAEFAAPGGESTSRLPKSGVRLKADRGDGIPAPCPADPLPGPVVSWRREFVGALICAGLVLLAYHQVAFGGKTFDTSRLVTGVNGTNPPTGVTRAVIVDNIRPDKAAGAWATYPWAQVTHRQIAQGEWPVWNPDEGTGEPLAGNAQSATFNPLLLAVFLHPTTRTWDLSLLFAFMLGAVATYAFLRRLGLCHLAAIAGSGAFTMSGFFAMDTSDTFVQVAIYLPLLFLGVDLVVSSPRLRWVGVMGVVVAGTILAGMPEETFFILVAATAYAGYRVANAPKAQRGCVASRLGGSGLLALALAGPFLLLFGQFLLFSTNSHGVTTGSATATTPALLYWLEPFWSGPLASSHLPVFGGDRGWCGTAVATLAVAGIGASRVMRRSGGWFFLGLATVVVLKNHAIPGVQWIGHLPVFSRANFVAFAPPVAQFCLAVGAAVGIHAIAADELHWRRLLIAIAAAAAAVLVVLGSGRGLLKEFLRPDVVRNDVVALLAGGTVLATCLYCALGHPSVSQRTVLAATAAAVVLLELFVLFPEGIYAPLANPYEKPPWLSLIAPASPGQPPPRVFGFDGLLYPNTAGVFGLEDVRTLNALYVSRYATYIRDFVSQTFTDRFTGTGMPQTEVEGNPMFNLLGVDYVLADTTPIDPSAGPSGTGQYLPIGSEVGILQVFRNTEALPRALVVQDIQRVSGVTAAVSYLKSHGTAEPDGTTRVTTFDPSTQAVVEVGQSVGTDLSSPVPSTSAPARSAQIISYADDRVVVHVSAGSAGLLVLTDAYYPGWQATVNGRRAKVLPTDVAFRGVPIGEGTSTVVFQYRPFGGDFGWALPLLGIAGFLAVGWFRRRRPLSLQGRHRFDRGA